MPLRSSGVAEIWKPLGLLLPSSRVRLRFNLLRSASALTTALADGIFVIIDSCKKLQNLDVTSCRQIPILDRRRIFEEGGHLIRPLSMLTSLIGMGGIPRVMQDEMRHSLLTPQEWFTLTC